MIGGRSGPDRAEFRPQRVRRRAPTTWYGRPPDEQLSNVVDDGIEMTQTATFSSVVSFSSSVTRMPSLRAGEHVGNEFVAVEAPPTPLRSVQQLVGHRERRLLAARALRHARAQLDGREARLDRVAGPQVVASACVSSRRRPVRTRSAHHEPQPTSATAPLSRAGVRPLRHRVP